MLTLSPGTVTIKTYTKDGEFEPQPDPDKVATGDSVLFVCHTEEDPSGGVLDYTWGCDGRPCDGMPGVLAVKRNELLVVLQSTEQKYSCEVSNGSTPQQSTVKVPALGQSMCNV